MLKPRERRGVSTFIAVLLMMVLAVSAGVVIYAYTMGYLGGLGSTQIPGALSLDSATCSTTVMKAYIRNIGKSSISIDAVYEDGAKSTGTLVQTDDPLPEGEVTKVTITYDSAHFTVGKTYEIKLVAIDNTQLTFTVKCK